MCLIQNDEALKKEIVDSIKLFIENPAGRTRDAIHSLQNLLGEIICLNEIEKGAYLSKAE